jgi:CelD/BcsL family acetyltransferase involved in cellulose biosynthesis
MDGSSASAPSIKVVTPFEISAPERDVWNRLCRSCRALRSAFYSYAYARAVAEVRSGIRVAVVERSGAPIAFLPFQYSGWLARLCWAAEPVGGNMTDYFGLVAPSSFEIASTDLLRLSGLASFLFTHLDETQLDHGLDGEKPEAGIRIDLANGAVAYWANLGRLNHRLIGDTERRMRKLVEALGPVRFEFRVPQPTAALDHLIETKRRQYARTGVEDSLAAPWRRALLHRLAESDDQLCYGIVSTLHAGDTWVASHFGLGCPSTLHYWFPVYNDRLRAYAPGRLLLKCIIDSAEEHGVSIIDRGAGDSPAKRDFATSSHLYYRGFWRRPSARATVFHLAMSVKWRLASLGSSRPHQVSPELSASSE